MVVLTGYETVKEALVNKADVFAERAPFPIFDEFAKGFGEDLHFMSIQFANIQWRLCANITAGAM